MRASDREKWFTATAEQATRIRVYGANDRARKRRPNRQGYCLSNVLYNNNNA